MRIAVQADDGDQISIKADVISVEQALVTLEINNPTYNNFDSEAVTLTIQGARDLAMALLSVAEAIEFVRTPANMISRIVVPPSVLAG